jgi:WD40 repeat protein
VDVRYAKKSMRHLPIIIIAILISRLNLAHGQIEVSKDSAANIALEGIWAIDWRFDDKFYALGGDDKILRIYRTSDMELFKAYSFPEMVRSISWHPNKERVIAVTTWGDNNGILDIVSNKFIPLDLPHGSRAVDWNFNGELLATADNAGLIKIWNLKGELLKSIKKQDTNSYFSMDWHPTKNVIAVSGDDIRIVDTTGITLKIIKHRKEDTGVLSVRWHPSGNFLATGDYGHQNEGVETLLQFWQQDGTLIKTIHGSKSEIRNLEWVKDGRYLATASDRLRIWDVNGHLLYEAKERDGFWGLDWNNKSDSIITASFSGNIILWTNKGKLLKIINKQRN